MHVLGTTVGCLLLIVGLPLLLSPIPVGIFVVPLGLVLLVISSPYARRGLERLRARSGKVDSFVETAEGKLPTGVGKHLSQTDPNHRTDRP